MKLLVILAMIFVLAGCSLQPTKENQKITPLVTLYDFQIIDSATEKKINIEQLAKKLIGVDVIFLGEYHGNHASHLLQAQLQAELFKQNPNQVLTMEQFNTDKQDVLERYMDSEIGEKILIKQANAWQNYRASYRPLVEFAKHNFLPVYAANAPANVVRCVGRKGQVYLTKFKGYENLPKQPFLNDELYEKKFMNFMNKMYKGGRTAKNSYYAQLLRDNSMAETIVKALKNHPKSQTIHLNGSFHSNNFLGIVALLKKRQPSTKIAVISPVIVGKITMPSYTKADLAKGDFIYLLLEQPLDYQQEKNRQQAFKKIFKMANQKNCQ